MNNLVRWYRLQDLKSLTTSANQPIAEAIDVLPFHEVLVQLIVAKTSGSGVLNVQTATVRDEAAFVNIGTSMSLSSPGAFVTSYTSQMRYLRWSASSVGGPTVFGVSVLGKSLARRPTQMVLAEPTVVAAAATQPREEWLDTFGFKALVFEVRRVKSATATLRIEHSAVPIDEAFMLYQSVSLSSTGPVIVQASPLRYVRWKITSITGTAVFQVDVVGRDAF